MQIKTSNLLKWLRLEADSFFDRKDGYCSFTIRLDGANINIPTQQEAENNRINEIYEKDKKNGKK